MIFQKWNLADNFTKTGDNPWINVEKYRGIKYNSEQQFENTNTPSTNRKCLPKHKATNFHDFSLKTQISSLVVSGIELNSVCYMIEFTLTKIARLETSNRSLTTELNRIQLEQHYYK